MDAESKTYLEGLLRQVPGALTEAERAFVRARVSYLTDDERGRFAEILDEAPAAAAPEVPQGTEDSEEKPRSRKKSD
jgi:hypothetical protein